MNNTCTNGQRPWRSHNKISPLCGVAVLLSLLLASGPALASPESRNLLLEGHGSLSAGKYDEALQRFIAATKADANDGEAFYFQGATLNRMGRFQEALDRFEKARTLGFKSPGLALDTGWALLRMGRWNDAIVQLEFFEKTVPGHGKTSEFLGEAYLGLKQYDRAESKLREAIERDAKLKPTALLYLAALELERQNRPGAEAYLKTLQQDYPESAIAQTLKTYRVEFRTSNKP
jgi:tetratricopeptide (TPR) repeat protein